MGKNIDIVPDKFIELKWDENCIINFAHTRYNSAVTNVYGNKTLVGTEGQCVIYFIVIWVYKQMYKP